MAIVGGQNQRPFSDLGLLPAEPRRASQSCSNSGIMLHSCHGPLRGFNSPFHAFE